MMPTVDPISTVSNVAKMPTSSDARAPCIARA
jgi:hypothetical protein